MSLIFPSNKTAEVINAAIENLQGTTTTDEGATSDGLIIKEDLSNVVQAGQLIANELTVDNFVNSVTNMLETVGRIYYETLTADDYDEDLFSLQVDKTEFACLREKVRIDQTKFEASFVLDENSSSTFSDLFGKHPFSFKVKVWGNKGFYRTKPFTISYEMYKTSVQNSNGWNELIARMWGVIDAIVEIALTESPWFLVRQQMANAAMYRSGIRVMNLEDLYESETGGTFTAANDPAFAKWFVKWQRHLRKIMRKATNKFCGASVPPINTPERYERNFLIDTFYDDINAGLSGVYHDDKIGNIDDYELVPYLQNVNEPTKIDIVPANPPVLTIGKHVTRVQGSGIVGMIWDRRGTFYNLEYKKVASNPNTFDDHVNYISTTGAQHCVDEDSNVVVFVLGNSDGFTITEESDS
ncbi:MAG: hypothetical protein J6R32_09360 [Bacteroidales bacterium]|nr:hypothetical protein [Bacteroidales bacterium]